jgi:hypothetical protein
VRAIVGRLENCRKIHLIPSFRGKGGNGISYSDCLFILFTIFNQEQRQITSFCCSPIQDGQPMSRKTEGRLNFDVQRCPVLIYKRSEFNDFRRNIQHLTLHMGHQPTDAKIMDAKIMNAKIMDANSFMREFLSSILTLQSVSLVLHARASSDNILEVLFSATGVTRSRILLCAVSASERVPSSHFSLNVDTPCVL